MRSRFKIVPSVFMIVVKGKKVLLQRRANTGWLDGWYDTPSGHLEDGEKLRDCARRELKEESGLVAKTSDLKLIHVYQNHHNPNTPYHGFMFRVKSWTGEPKIMEPAKCDDMGFFELKALPPKTVPYVIKALKNLNSREVSFSFFGPGSIT